MSDIKICDKCKYSNPQDLIKGIIWCSSWKHCFDYLDKCGQFKDKEAESE